MRETGGSNQNQRLTVGMKLGMKYISIWT